MKIRAGFVSNSSSTSYLMISKEDLREEAFFALMGVAVDSPIADLFRELFHAIVGSSQYVDFGLMRDWESPETWFDGDHLSPVMVARLQQAAKRGLKAYFGSLSSDESLVLSFFCTDAFEIENGQIYFNYLECAW